ncbi:hypothetical protein [Micromonospora sp. WMMD812]|uniref:hypothetical protein n=1 Tax=Micromonospora sp. WMMD812 TaxID=3015152 RepID=UPI00248C8D98|nr:hypothetical protein [Micromonospora sp. WMMD812]WBB70582.1 hypothetical protein O7603_15000 [Micromonospora sp. WMMD812]
MTATIMPIASAHPAFDQVAALFDDYRAHYGQPSTPEITRSGCTTSSHNTGSPPLPPPELVTCAAS